MQAREYGDHGRSRSLADLRPPNDQRLTASAPPRPNAAQLAFQDLELGLFIHFGMNTYTAESTGGVGTSPPETFNPTELDCDNWMAVARAMDARFAVLTSRHEEGFCLWPTESTNYSVRQSRWKGGKGDVVREFVDACRRHDIRPCLYHSSYMDAHHIFHDDDPTTWHEEWFRSTRKRLSDPAVAERFTRMQVRQIRELLTQYGDIDYLWLDHIGETQGILDPEAVDEFWLAILEEASRWQPDCLLLKRDVYLTRDPDTNGGVHGGRAAYPLWYSCRRENQLRGQGQPIADPNNGDQFIVWESNTIFSGQWFWNGPMVKPIGEMIEHYYATVGRGSTFLPNFAPDPRGLMTDAVLSHARAFGDAVRSLNEGSLAETAGPGPSLVLSLPSSGPVDHVVIMEDLREGQHIAAYVIEARTEDDRWFEIARGESIGHKRIDRFPQIATDALRLTCTSLTAKGVHIRRFAAFSLGLKTAQTQESQ